MSGSISIETIIENIRNDIKERNLSVSERFLTTPYYGRRIDTLRSADQIVLVGAGIFGRRLYEMLCIEEIADKVGCFCDNSIGRQDRNPMSIPVISVENAVKEYPRATFVITPKCYENELLQQLGGLGVPIDRIMIFTFEYTGLVD